jgi:hypothetical protein
MTWVDRDFMDAVQELYVPSMGSDVMAPLLYSLIRFVRARTVLEVGMGYTTPFIARALKDNDDAFRAERSAVIRKSDAYLRDVDAMDASAKTSDGRPEQRGLPAVYQPKTSRLADRRTEWMFADPAALLRPGYYLEERRSQLYCIDNIAVASSSARFVKAKLDQLDLSSFVTDHYADFWSFDIASAVGSDLPFDLIWLDVPVSVRNVMSLLNGPHWKLLNPNGGLLLIHDMLTHEGGQMLVKEFFKADQQKRFDEFEFVGLLEPQRIVQNSFVMLRKISGFRADQFEKQFTAPGEATLEHDARELCARGDAVTHSNDRFSAVR